ncbi:MAG: hypothetical protein IJG34_04940 [Synergistaceae bacterium]|nr:hypothetical protein [Synergistaceae bacterium]
MKSSRFIALVMLFVMVSNISADAYRFSETRKDSPADFNSFLNSCTNDELRQMMTALRETGEATPEAIRKALVWRAYNKTTYMFRGDSEVDYHGILQWAAGKSGIDSKTIEYSPTYALEKAVAEKYFAKLWENMTPEQREELIKNVIKNEDGKFSSKLGDALKDPNLRESIMYMIMMNPELAAAVIGGAVALLVGTFGVLGIAAGGVWLAWSESDTVSAFIMTVNIIKTRRYKK